MSLIGWLKEFNEGRIRLILGSASPARRRLLEQLNIPFQVMVSDFAENLDKSSFEDLTEYPVATSLGKTTDLLHKLRESDDVSVLLTCDTVVIRDGRFIMEKPNSCDHAADMISSLAGKEHAVVTGVVITLIAKQGTILAQDVFKEISTVKIVTLSSSQVEDYVRTGEPMGKAGGYGIQGLGEILIESVSGSYTNVVGIPLHRVAERLGQLLEFHIK
jgi:septum formation protein